MSAEAWALPQAQLAVAPRAEEQDSESIPRVVNFDVDRETGTAVAAVSGDVSPAALADLGALLRHSLAEGCTQMILDLTECTDFPPHGAGLLNRLADEARISGGSLTLRGVRDFDVLMMHADGLAQAVTLGQRQDLPPSCPSTVGLGATA